MTIALKIACGLFAAMMAMLGIRWWFAFDGVSAEWMVQALSPVGVNNLTADMGSLFLGGALLVALGLRQGKQTWLLAAALLMAVAAAGRLYLYATAGYLPATLVPLLVEVVSCALLIGTHRRMSAE
jgi:hypothetical protein